MKLVLDIETTFTLNGKKTNPSPYLSTNRLVSVGVKVVDGKDDYIIFHHKENTKIGLQEETDRLQDYLNEATTIIGHNLRFDIAWLKQCGFTYEGKLYDTMSAEYVFSKGQKLPLSLDECCKRYNLDAKSDVLSEYRNKGINTDEVPLQELITYGMNDVIITEQLYKAQQSRIINEPDCAYMLRAIDLMNNTLDTIIDMERAGVCINLDTLNQVEQEYKQEYARLETELTAIIIDKMGATPINLESPEHLSWVLYSRKVNDKKLWTEIFNLGTELRGSVRKLKYSPRMNKTEFIETVRNNTTLLKKTEANQCEVCVGKGKVLKIKKSGESFKKETICKECSGAGFKYKELKSYAGFKLIPQGSEYTSSGGFSTDKVTLTAFLKQEDIDEVCKKFIITLLRLNSISTYLSAFVGGFKDNVIGNILHCNFNPCVTATGRLSCTRPNLQNLPRNKTFPIRKTIVSRFKEGVILSVDFEKFEFTIAAILSGCAKAREDILNGIDVHIFTRDTLNSAGLNIDRQQAKSRTFAPLYGATGNTPEERLYYRAFLDKYAGIRKWHEQLEQEALATKQIKSPSGRIYAFPNCKRLSNGTVLGHTQLKNYIVQGLATGDITPIALIEIHKRMKGLKSKLILTVHDSIDADCHPDEIEAMKSIFKSVFDNMNNYVKDYFGIDTDIPIKGEFKIGKTWGDLEAA